MSHPAKSRTPSEAWRSGASRVRGYGDVAQLGERVLCKHEVAGSTPAISTKRDRNFLEEKFSSSRSLTISVVFSEELQSNATYPSRGNSLNNKLKASSVSWI
jgi:hypothetical protein